MKAKWSGVTLQTTKLITLCGGGVVPISEPLKIHCLHNAMSIVNPSLTVGAR